MTKANKTETDLVGKVVSITLLDRSESEWSQVKCIGASENLLAIEYENRGVVHQNFFPWRNISYISIRYSNSTESPTGSPV